MKKRGLLLTVLCIAVMMTGGCGVGNEAEDNTKITDNSSVDKSTEQETDEETTKCTETLESLNINPHDIMEYIGEAPEGAEYPERYITDYEVIQAEPFILEVENRSFFSEPLRSCSYFSENGFLFKYNDKWYELTTNVDNIKKSHFYIAEGDSWTIQIEGKAADGRYRYKGAVSMSESSSLREPIVEIGILKEFEITKDGRTYYIDMVYNDTDVEKYFGRSLDIVGYTYVDDDTIVGVTMFLGADEPIFKEPEEFLAEEFVNNYMTLRVYE